METAQTTNQPTQPQPNQPLVQPSPIPQTDMDGFTVTRISCTPAEQKTIPGTGAEAKPPTPPQYYYQIPLMYNFGNDEKRVLNDFLFEGCEMSSKTGIQSKAGQSGRFEHSIMVTFDENDAEQARFLEIMGQIHGGCAYILAQMKGAVKLYNFNNATPQMAIATGLKDMVYRPRDEMTGEPIQGRAPSMFLKLFSRGKPPMVEQTLFTDLDAKPIPWNLLTGVEVKFIPLIHVKRIYVGGGKASIQMETISAVVTSVRARNTTTTQTGTIERLRQARPQLQDQVAAQLAKLTTDRQDQMLGVPAQQPQQDQGHAQEPQTTFAGIVPTGQRQMTQPQMSQITQNNGFAPGQLPAIPPLAGNVAAMQDFTANAPTRVPVMAGIPAVNKSPSPQTNVVQLS